MAKRLTAEQELSRLFAGLASSDGDKDPTVAALRREEAIKKRERDNAPRDWSGVTASSFDSSAEVGGTKAPPSDPLAKLWDSFGGYTEDLAGSAFNDVKSGMGARIFTHDDMGNKKGAEVARGLYDQFNFEGGGPIGALLQQLKGEREDTSALGKRLYTEGSEAKGKIAQKYDDSNWIAQGGVDLFGSPLSALSVIGGPTGALMGEDVFNKTYAETRLSGVDKEGAAARAAGHGGLETAIASIPAGKFLAKIPQVNRLLPREALVDLMGNATKFAYKTGITVAGESAEEVTTELAQMGFDKLLAAQNKNKELAKHAQENLPKSTGEFFTAVRRAAVAGAMGGAALGGPMESLNIMKAAGQEAAMLAHNIDAANNEFNPAKTADVPRSNAIAPTQPDMFGTPEGLPSYESQEAARQKDLEIQEGLRQGRNAEQNEAALAENRELQRVNLEAAVDTNRQKVEGLQEQVAAGKNDSQTLSSLAAALRDTKRAENLLANHNNSAPKKAAEGIVAPTAPAKDAVQTDLFSNQESAQLDAQRATAQAARQEAAKVIEKEGKGVQDKAKQARAAARRTFMEEQKAATANLEPEARIDAMADATIEWDAANPVENFVGAPTAVAPKKPTKKKLTSKPAAVEPVAKAVQTTEDELGSLLKGLSSTTPNETGKTDTKVADVTKALVSTIGQGNTRVLAKLINDKNLKVVGDASQIPNGAAPAGAAGFYDGKQMYVVANKLDKDNIVGGMLEIAAHETKHAADISGKVTLGGMVGAKANRALNAKIIAAMKRGDIKAKAAYDNAKAGSTSDAEFELELPAYYINEARDSSGSSRAAIMRDALNAVRAAAKRILPGEYKVELSDVAHLSKVLLREAAIQGKQMEGNIDGGLVSLPMIMGPGSKDFAKAKAEGRTYTAPDGIERFTSSDSEAVLNRKKAHDVTEGKDTPITDIYTNDVLFDNYPKLRDVKVRVDPNLTEKNAYYDENEGAIYLARDIPARVNDKNGFDYMEEVITHELQHAIQGVEGMSRGGSPNSFLDEGDRRIAAKASTSKRALTQVEQRLRSSLQNLNLNNETMEEIRNHLSQSAISNPDRTASLEHIADAISADHGANSAARNIGGDIRKAVAESRTNNKRNEQAEAKREEYYQRLYGEIEARNVADNRKRTQDQLPINPETAELEDGGFDRDAETSIPNDAPGKSFSGLAFTPTQRAAVEKNDNAAVRAIKRLLFPGGGFDPKLEESLQHSKGLAAELALEGDFLGNELLRAFNTATVNNVEYRRKGEPWVREEVSKRMDKIDELPTRDQRNAALTALDRDFPGVGTAIRNIRDAKIELSREIIRLRFREVDANGNLKPLDDKERAMFAKTVENAERYTTRAYLATYNKEIGRGYGKNLLARAKQDPNSEQGQTLAAALDYLVSVELVIPDPADLAELGMGKLRRLHENWIGPAENFKKSKGKAAMIQALTDYKNNNVMDLDAKAMEVVKDMLQQTTVKSRLLSSITTGAKQNRTILEGRTDIPAPLRKLLGEITDPFLRESISLYRMNNLVAKAKLLVEVAEKGKAEGWYSDKRTDKFSEQLNGPAYGAMDGKWISQDTSDALTGTILHFTNLDASMADSLKNPTALMEWTGGKMLPVSNSIMSIQKTWQVVANPMNMLFNLGGSPVMALSQGIINPKTYAKGMHGAMTALMLEVTSKYAGKDSITTASEVVRAGAVDSATMGEFKTEAYQTIVKQITKLDPNDKNFMVKAAKVMGKEFIGRGSVANSLRQIYSFMDVWVKTATYYDRKNFLTEFNKLENTGKSQDLINRQAGYEAAGTNISYERAIPLVKMIERNIPFAMFLTYFSEVPRSMAMSYIQVVRDTAMANNAKTPEGRRLATTKAATRLAGTLIANLGVVAATMAVLDNDDEEEKRRRQLDAEYQQNRVMVSVGKDENGNDRMLTINRFDAAGPLNEAIIDLLMAPEGKKAKAALDNVKDLFVASKGWIKAYQILHDATIAQAMPDWDMRRNRNTMLENKSPAAYQMISEIGPELGLGENAVSAVEALFAPSGITGLIGADDSRNAFGFKAYVRDPDKSLKFRVMDYTNEMKRLKTKQKDFIERQHVMSAGSVADRMTSLLQEEKAAYDNLRKAYDGFLAYDERNPAKAKEIFGRDGAAFKQAQAKQFKSTLLDQKSLQKWYKEKLKDKTVDRAKLREDYALLRKAYLEVGQDGKKD